MRTFDAWSQSGSLNYLEPWKNSTILMREPREGRVKVLIDTTVWSLVLRRRNPDARLVQLVAQLEQRDAAYMIGPVRQELLTHLEPPERFRLLRDSIRSIRDLSLSSDDFEQAAALSTACRSRGIIASPTDFLVVAVARRESAAVLSLDRDFDYIRKVIAFRRMDT